VTLSSLIKTDKFTGSKQEFYVPLCDVLMDLAEQEIDEEKAWRLSQIAHSLAHDLLNVATLAGRLLWYEGVTPDMDRSPDLVAIAVDTETYLITLRSACDPIAEAFSQFCVDPKKFGQIPDKTDSFREMLRWSTENTSRLRENFHFITGHSEWFMHLRSLRNKIVHNGFYSNIYTDRILFKFFLFPGVVKLRRGRGTPRDGESRRPTTQVPLISLLKRFTTSVLELSEQLSAAIESQLKIGPSKTHVLSGVYVPALNHLLSYEQPAKRDDLNLDILAERRRHASARYLLVADDYLGAIRCGYPNGFWWRYLMRLSDLFSNPAKYVSPPLFGGANDALVGWHFIFCEAEQNFALSLRDRIALEVRWLQGERENLDAFARRANASKALLVANQTRIPESGADTSNIEDFIIIEADPVLAAERTFAAFTSSRIPDRSIPSG
jgi:hypothetical protein